MNKERILRFLGGLLIVCGIVIVVSDYAMSDHGSRDFFSALKVGIVPALMGAVTAVLAEKVRLSERVVTLEKENATLRSVAGH